MEIYKYLEKSSCRDCGEKTCLAFAGAVYQSRKEIHMCPKVGSKVVELYSSDPDAKNTQLESGEQFIENLKKIVAGIDLNKAATRTGGHYDGQKLTVTILGKDFGLDSTGNFTTDIHVNPWISGPLLDYVINVKGSEPTGDWVSFRELKEATEVSYPFFQKRCELAM